jgi:hypothetical protein
VGRLILGAVVGANNVEGTLSESSLPAKDTNVNKKELVNPLEPFPSTTATEHPCSLRIKDAAAHFRLAAPTLYQWVSNGRLRRGKEYLKIGRCIVIIREAFIDFLFREDGTNGDSGEDNEQPIPHRGMN